MVVLENIVKAVREKMNVGCAMDVYILAQSGDLRRGKSSPGGWSQRV